MFKKILLATNGSESSKKAEDYALYLVKREGAELTVVHVLDDKLCHYGYVDQLVPGTTKEQFVSYIISECESTAQKVILEFTKKAEEQGLSFSLRLRKGEPYKEIVAVATEENMDLIIIGGRPPHKRRSRFKIPGTGTAEKVAKLSPCSVMMVV
ncbi:Universal stress protein UspA [Dissulfuribacter thermophilus]|uniref:Universal stress protein UspA n=1 Tax=Dissulfuribacter thermophilus TaxID=1156395 RepID=A0A1B9F2M1_9BACT|nr:universal stress protein [Dissulfuribacter thermophilus]OCC14170.1 Universal stress protein UspA [Dissulfuribacter thermophilus]